MVSAAAGVLIVAAVVVAVYMLMPKEGRSTAGWVRSGAGGSTVALCLTGGFALGLALLLNGVLQ